MKYLILFLALTGCGATQPHAPTLVIPEKYQYMYNRFLLDAKTHGLDLNIVDLIIEDADLSSELENGSCTHGFNVTPTIKINTNPAAPFFWDGADDTSRENIFYHEMGHCVLERWHDPNDIFVTIGGLITEIPESIMNPYPIDEDTYQYEHDYYLNELFSNATKMILGLQN
jgi:hypothetical protein